MTVIFATSGVETQLWLPFIVALFVSGFTSIGGVSGAFILLPFQMSVLGFTGPAVSATNLLFNIIAIPAGIYRFIHEKRMVWSLTWIIIAGTLPGVLGGVFFRILFLPDPRHFKLFVALVLIYMGIRLLGSLKSEKAGNGNRKTFVVEKEKVSFRQLQFHFNGEEYRASTPGLFILSFIVGLIGGTYGIGGGAIVAPFLISFFRFPVHAVAGATLMGTFLTSVSGVAFYSLINSFDKYSHLSITPDWWLGLLLGCGGAIGIYMGARLQKFIPPNYIKVLLIFILFFISIKYLVEFF